MTVQGLWFDPYSVSLQPGENQLTSREAFALARIAEHADRPADVVRFVHAALKDLSFNSELLGSQELSLITAGFKQLAAQLRSSWAAVADYSPEDSHKIVIEYQEFLQGKMLALADHVRSDIVTPFVEQEDLDAELRVFFKKMEGDFLRYGAEITAPRSQEAEQSDAHISYRECSRAAYLEAIELSGDQLPTATPASLGAALNFSIFLYEIDHQPLQAMKVAKKAFDDAIPSLDALDSAAYRTANELMETLQENLSRWTVNHAQEAAELACS